MTSKAKVCSVCFNICFGKGHNANPINNGKCCDRCNDIVILARMNQMKNLIDKKFEKRFCSCCKELKPEYELDLRDSKWVCNDCEVIN